MFSRKSCRFVAASATLIASALAAHPVCGSIVAVNDGNFGGAAPPLSGIVTQSVTVGAGADMLIVMTAMELGGITSPMTVTYGGVSMNLAVGNQDWSAIWYLDLATPGITGTNVVVDMSGYGVRNGFAAGWVSIDGNLGVGESIALQSTGTSSPSSNTVDLTTTSETFNVVNFNGNQATGTVTVNSPNPEVIYTDTNIGSARSAAAYEEAAVAGLNTYQWTLTDGSLPVDYRRIDAAAFVVVPEPGPLAMMGVAGLGGLLMLRRRRC
jgi:hypothetical protein